MGEKTITKSGKIIVHLSVWLTLLLVPLFLFDSFARISRYAPFQYYLSFLLLIPFYYWGNHFLKRRSNLAYLPFVLSGYLLYLFVPTILSMILPNNLFIVDFYSISPSHQAKIRMGTSILFLLTTASSMLRHMYFINADRNKLKAINTKAELSLLQSQINPHFFFNSLNTIYYLALKKDEATPKAIIGLSDMMRYVLTDAKEDFVPLSLEIAYISKFLELQKMRIPEKTHLHYECDIDQEPYHIAPLILMPFIENAFKYGISATKETSIIIKMKLINDTFSFSCKNDILPSSQYEKGTGCGIENVTKRLKLIYPERYDLNLKIEESSFTVDLIIKLYQDGKK